MSLSIRHSIQWVESELLESEPTSTVVITSPSGKYVDIRKLKDSKDGKDVFDWYFAGYEIDKKFNVIEFNHDFLDSKYIDHYYKCNKSKFEFEFKIDSDIGTFSNSKDLKEAEIGVRIETGKMINPETGYAEKYIEKWISCNPESSDLKFENNGDYVASDCIVLDTINGGIIDNEMNDDVIIGRFIKYGKWIQGILWDKSKVEKSESVGVLRMVENGEVLINYGGQIDKFPKLEQLKGVFQGDVIEVNGVYWKIIELC